MSRRLVARIEGGLTVRKFAAEIRRHGRAHPGVDLQIANSGDGGFLLLLPADPDCQGCASCDDDGEMFRSRMFLCPTCGNKRCPHASDHRHECTGSNAVGQAGSDYAHGAPGLINPRWVEPSEAASQPE